MQGDRAQSCFFDCFVHTKKRGLFHDQEHRVVFFMFTEKSNIFGVGHLLRRRAMSSSKGGILWEVPGSDYKPTVHFSKTKTKAESRLFSWQKKRNEKSKRRLKKGRKVTNRLAQPVCRNFFFKLKVSFIFSSEEVKIAKRNLFFLFFTF